MKKGAISTAGPGRRYFYLLTVLLAGLTLAGCRTCPIDSCHIRKAHYHNAVKYRARPIWKMQYPAVGEKIKIRRGEKTKRNPDDRSKPLK
jgi:hypothetical protein